VYLRPRRRRIKLGVLVAVQDHNRLSRGLVRGGVGAGGAFDAEPGERVVGVAVLADDRVHPGGPAIRVNRPGEPTLGEMV
jgi:hypothetical protein